MLHAERPRTRRSPEPETLVRIRLFGPISVQAGDTVLGPREFGGIKPKQIFEILLLERGHPVPKDRLAEWLWGDALPRNVAATLETYISNIRSAFGPSRIGHRLVVTERDAYRLDGRSARSTSTCSTGSSPAASRARPCGPSLESALELARGEVLEDEPWAEWAEPVRERYRRATLRARLDLAELLLALRDFPAAALHAELALAQEALDERAVRLTMLARYAMGRQGEALDAYRQCRAALAKDLGLEPTPETKGLEAAMLRQEALESLLPPHGGRGARRARLAASRRWTASGSISTASSATSSRWRWPAPAPWRTSAVASRPCCGCSTRRPGCARRWPATATGCARSSCCAA